MKCKKVDFKFVYLLLLKILFYLCFIFGVFIVIYYLNLFYNKKKSKI